MRNLINEIYDNTWTSVAANEYDHERYQAIKNGNFVLYGPSRQVLLPRMWSRVVKPGWMVKLRYRNFELNPKWLVDMDDRKRKEEVTSMQMKDMEQEAEHQKLQKILEERRRKDEEEEEEKRLAKENTKTEQIRKLYAQEIGDMRLELEGRKLADLLSKKGKAGRRRLFKDFIKGD